MSWAGGSQAASEPDAVSGFCHDRDIGRQQTFLSEQQKSGGEEEEEEEDVVKDSIVRQRGGRLLSVTAEDDT